MSLHQLQNILTNAVEINRCSYVMQGLTILSFSDNLVIICVFYPKISCTIFFSFTSKMGCGPPCLRVFIYPLAEVSQWNLELRKSRFNSFQVSGSETCHEKKKEENSIHMNTKKRQKACSIFPYFSNDSSFKLACLSALWMAVLFGNFHAAT